MGCSGTGLGGFLGGEMLSGGNIQFCPQSICFWKAVLCGISHFLDHLFKDVSEANDLGS